jgi:TetR/AcrR family fatty acid metabolism transcriptional regulator
VFARQGYTGTVVDDIAEEAGIAKGTLYLYFRSKEEIYLAALTEDIKRVSTQTQERMSLAPTFTDKLRTFLALRLEYVETHQDFLRIYLAEFGSLCVRYRPLSRELEELFRENCYFLAAVIEDAVAKGEIRTVPPQPTAFALFELARGLAEKRLLGWSTQSAEEDLAFTLNLIWHGLVPEAASGTPNPTHLTKVQAVTNILR